MNYSLLTLAAVAAFSASVAATPAHAAQPSELIVDGGLRCTNLYTYPLLDVKAYLNKELVGHSPGLHPSSNESQLQACERSLDNVCDYLKTFNTWSAAPIHITYSFELVGPAIGLPWTLRKKGTHICD